MSGIAGIWNFDDTWPDRVALRRMVAALRHRGPDGEGVWQRGSIGLAHTRLAVLDLGGPGQPLLGPDADAVVVVDGEIANYRQLRRDLDYPFRTDGDAETVLAAHRVHGTSATSMLHGQFAYAHFDRRAQRLVLARDRLGILPLYWFHDGRRLVFGSEVATILAALGTVPDLDPVRLTDYLTRRAVRSPHTLLTGIRKLRPGHLLEVGADGTLAERRYWSPDDRGPRPITPEDAVAHLSSLLDVAVDRALTADVPVGTHLSGGVDSSLIAARAAARSPERLHTFCAEFGDARVDESAFAAHVAGMLHTRHHVVPVRPADFQERWERLSWHRGAPLSEPADVAVFQLARAARQHVSVLLSGEGSDELFAGYPKHRFATATAYTGAVPAPARGRLVGRISRMLPPSARRLDVALRALSEPDAADRRRAWFAPFTTAERRTLLGEVAREPLPATGSPRSPLRAMMREDLESWLSDNLLERGDRMTMAASVELRAPFLDEDVVDFALRLPPRVLLRHRTTKWVVKEVARTQLPGLVVDRPKRGFPVPLDAWFRSGLHDFARDLLADPDSIASTYLDRRAVTDLLDSHLQGTRDQAIRIWTLASLEVWHRSLRVAAWTTAAPRPRVGLGR